MDQSVIGLAWDTKQFNPVFRHSWKLFSRVHACQIHSVHFSGSSLKERVETETLQ